VVERECPGANVLDASAGSFTTDQNACGVANVFLGETGYNARCPSVYARQQVPDERTYITQMVNAACQSQVTGPLAPFLFEFGDICPCGGHRPGCPGEPQAGIETENVQQIF
jgi:hypothetical protein